MADGSQEQDSERWNRYYEARKERQVAPLLLKALEYMHTGGDALDLGCGTLIETKELLRRGFHVTAIDSSPQVRGFAEALANDNLTCVISTFDAFDYQTYDIVHASYSLPFNPPETFDSMIRRVFAAIRPGGIFVAQLFGINDSWNTPDTAMTFHTRNQVERLLRENGLDMIDFNEVEQDGMAVFGPKHWHLFNIVATARART